MPHVNGEEEEEWSSLRFQVTIFGEIAGGWSVSQQLVRKILIVIVIV